MKKTKLCRGNSNDQDEIFPHHVIAENILPRLPVKSLLRFKTVCKTWLSSISSTAFQKTHLRFSTSAPKFLLFHIAIDRKFFLLSYDESKIIVSDLVQLDSNILIEHSDQYSLIGSWNGLLCLHLEAVDSFTLWNPATGHYKIIPGYSQTIDDDFCLNTTFGCHGFGYVSSTDDYKILVMYWSLLYDRLGYFYLFSLNTGTWKSLDYLDGTYYANSLSDLCATYMDDTMYWSFENQDTRALIGIIGFNLVHDQMNKVQKIPWLCNYSKVDQIFKMKGCLSLCCSNEWNPVSDVWLLKQQGGPKTWLKMFSIDCKITPVLDFTENGKYLVQHSGQLKLIDPNEEDTDHLTSGVDCDYKIVGPESKYVESLISF